MPVSEDLKFKMALHRDLLRGNGFYDTLVPRVIEDLGKINLNNDEAKAVLPRHLPVVKFIKLDKDHVNALFEEVALADRHRFCKYLSSRPLGLGCITGVSYSFLLSAS